MQKKITSIIIFLIFVLLVINSKTVSAGAAGGMRLWLEAVVPSLLPFMILSNIIILSGLSHDMNFLFCPLTKVLRITPDASYCILSGILFGYPACAISSHTLQSKGIIDSDTALYCTCCFNNISPSFIAGYFCTVIINSPKLTFKILLLFYLSVFSAAFILRFTLFRRMRALTDCAHTRLKESLSDRNIMEDAMTSSLHNILIIGCNIIIFSVLCTTVMLLPTHKMMARFICSLTEITTGLSRLSESGLD